jgi:hypothetical protein
MPWQSDKERAQDQYNNDLAKRLMEESPQATREQYEQRALKAVKSGEAQSGLTEKDLRYRAKGSPKKGESKKRTAKADYERFKQMAR